MSYTVETGGSGTRVVGFHRVPDFLPKFLFAFKALHSSAFAHSELSRWPVFSVECRGILANPKAQQDTHEYLALRTATIYSYISK